MDPWACPGPSIRRASSCGGPRPGGPRTLQCAHGQANPSALQARARSCCRARRPPLPGPHARVKALHSICPGAAGFLLYERFRSEVKRLQKDPDPGVRTAALHAEHDACEIETIEAGLERPASMDGDTTTTTGSASTASARPPANGCPSDQQPLSRSSKTPGNPKLRKSSKGGRSQPIHDAVSLFILI